MNKKAPQLEETNKEEGCDLLRCVIPKKKRDVVVEVN